MSFTEDRVILRMAGRELSIVEGYSVEQAVLTQPGRFDVRLGHSGIAKDLFDRYPPLTPFELLIRIAETGKEVRQFIGKTDARAITGAPESATVAFRGRDELARLHDANAAEDKSYTNKIFRDLIVDVLLDAGYKDILLLEETVTDRQAKTGASKVPNVTRIKEGGWKTRVRKALVHPPQIRPGERYYDFLDRILKRAGISLYATTDGAIVLSEPDPNLAPIYKITNRRTEDNARTGQVLSFDFEEDTVDRFSEAIVFGRGGGGKFGRTTQKGEFGDEEMRALALFRPRAFVDSNVSSLEEALFFARRKVAESRRSGWALTYTVAGHTTPALDGSGRLVWARDTMVEVDDPELGISGPHWIEHVAFRGTNNETTTNLRLMRPQDMVFGTDVE